MKHVAEFRDAALGRRLAAAIAGAVRRGRRYRLMEFCGGHTHALARHGLLAMLPPEIEMIHGPGCPVCVLPVGRLDQAIRLARREGVTLCAFGDMMRVPARDRETLLTARASGADVRVVYGAADALALARADASREVRRAHPVGRRVGEHRTVAGLQVIEAGGGKIFIEPRAGDLIGHAEQRTDIGRRVRFRCFWFDGR